MHKKIKLSYIAVPAKALRELGISPDSTVEASVENNRIIIQKAIDEECLCDLYNDDCEGCPFCCPKCGECLKEQFENSEKKEDSND